MKHLLLVMALVLLLGFGKVGEAKASNLYTPLSQVISRSGLKGKVAFVNVFCVSQTAYRSGKYGRKPQYLRAVYYAWDQFHLAKEGYGELMVSLETKCFEGSIRNFDTYVQWRTTYYYAPQWELQGWYPVSLKMMEKNRFCRAQKVGVAYDRSYSTNDNWKEKSFQKVMFEVILDGRIKGSPYEIYETYVSRDIKCFSSMKEAQKGGYRLITNW